MPKRFRHSLLNDSKQLTRRQREELVDVIKTKAIAYEIAEVSNVEIDKINILNASFKAMHKAIASLTTRPELLIIDGNRFTPYDGIDHKCIIKGDSKYYSIAAASVLAKTHRDQLMRKLSEEYPHYRWETNVGYPTREHREGIKSYGISPFHRKSFQLLPSQLEIFPEYQS